jgi:hypothetical protein
VADETSVVKVMDEPPVIIAPGDITARSPIAAVITGVIIAVIGIIIGPVCRSVVSPRATGQ